MQVLRADGEGRAPKRGVGIPLADEDDVTFDVGTDHEQRLGSTPNAKALTLADSEEVSAGMGADFFTGAACRGDFDDVAGFGSQFLLEEGGKVDLTNEANTLRIFTFSGSEVLLFGDTADVGFEKVADGKQGLRKLVLRKLAEEVTLVFAGVGAGEKAEKTGVGLGGAAIMTGSNGLSAEFESLAEEYVELDLAVTKNVGVRSTAGSVLGEHIIDDSFAVLGRKIDEMEGNVEFLSNEFSEKLVVSPRAIAGKSTGSIVPITHKKANNLEPLLFEEECGNGRINPAGKTYDDFFHTRV